MLGLSFFGGDSGFLNIGGFRICFQINSLGFEFDLLQCVDAESTENLEVEKEAPTSSSPQVSGRFLY